MKKSEKCEDRGQGFGWQQALDLVFPPRCTLCSEQCRKTRPELVDIAPGHMVRCHNIDQTVDFRGMIELPEKEVQ